MTVPAAQDLVRWAEAARGDRQALQTFACTTPGKKRQVGGRWELEHDHQSERVVQSLVRHRLNPPCPSPEFALLGHDADGICAVGYMLELGEPRIFEIRVVAVALRRRRDPDSRVGDQLLNMLLNEATQRALNAGEPEMQVMAQIARDNHCSQKLFTRFGFANLEVRNEMMHMWGARIPVMGAELNGFDALTP